jgi:transposase-like protein
MKKEEVLKFAGENSVTKAAEKFGVSAKTIYAWQGGKKEGVTVEAEGDYVVIRIPKKVVLKEALGNLLS